MRSSVAIGGFCRRALGVAAAVAVAALAAAAAIYVECCTL